MQVLFPLWEWDKKVTFRHYEIYSLTLTAKHIVFFFFCFFFLPIFHPELK